MQIELVSVQNVDQIWPVIAGSVAHCLRKAPMEIGAGDIWTNCRSGSWLLLIAHDGQAVAGTTVWRFTSNGYFDCVILVGDHPENWLSDLIANATSIAKSNGCRGLVATGRPGLIKHLKQQIPNVKAARVTYASEF